MRIWIEILVAAASILLLSTLFFLLKWRWYCFRKRRGINNDSTSPVTRTDILQDGIAKLQQGSPSPHPQVEGLDTNKVRSTGNNHAIKRGGSTRPLFNWTDHPCLITDAAENGWSRFGFTSYKTSSSPQSLFLGMCAVGQFGKEVKMDTSWEVSQGSADFMQKIRLKHGSKKVNVSSNFSAASVIRTVLPVPGPPLWNSSFPQEAYFEVTVLHCCGHQESVNGKVSKEGEKTKLIQENFESLAHGGGSINGIRNIEELKLGGQGDERGGEAVLLSLGLSAGGSLPLKLPGSYLGSIGFNSNGSVFLDGIELVYQSEKSSEWARPNKVIGCGYDPRQKRVFFTVDGELLHVIHCKSEEFGTPLYPTIAANTDIQVVVNFGQISFSYSPANSQRTPNPCYIGSLVKSPTLGYEDSKELFSIGRIDSQHLNRTSIKGATYINGTNCGINYPVVDFDEESEADLFEIVLDCNGRSPIAPL